MLRKREYGKVVQSHQSKKKDSMTPEDLKDYKKEAFRIKNLRNRKISTEHFNKEKTSNS